MWRSSLSLEEEGVKSRHEVEGVKSRLTKTITNLSPVFNIIAFPLAAAVKDKG